jgi:3-phenylpropionate/trans-cinnamate dioxygenase ferredoxin reductase subunit
MSAVDVLIVGSGHGGVQAASELRKLGFAGSIAILSADRDMPYERPPLSKDYLAGEKDFTAILARSHDFWDEKSIDLHLGEEVVQIEPDAGRVTCSSGLSLGYGKLVWAAGGTPRNLTCDGHDLKGLHAIRTRADVDRLKGELEDATRIVVIGGGYIGLEAAASLTKLGKHVTVIEAVDRLLARVAAAPLSDFFLAEHRRHGVDVHLGETVKSVLGDGGRVERVSLADGRTIPADIVIVGIGITPAVEPLSNAGAETPNGVTVDDYCRTGLPNVYAIGDCALHRNVFGPDAAVRVESVQNAVDQANVVARHILGEAQPYAATPWFWSNQYDVKLQTVGLNTGFDDHVVRGDPRTGRFSIVYLREGTVVALDCVNMVKDYVQGRKLVEARVGAERALLGNPDFPLKSLIDKDTNAQD